MIDQSVHELLVAEQVLQGIAGSTVLCLGSMAISC